MSVSKKNNKAEAIWQKLKYNEHFNQVVALYRKILLIPNMGFANNKEEIKWAKKILLDEKRMCELDNFSRAINTYDWRYDISGMERIINKYLKYNKINQEILFNADVTHCDLFFLTPQNLNVIKNKMSEGVYVKIGMEARPVDIKLFFKQKKLLIEAMQTIFLKDKGKVIKPTKHKRSKNMERDDAIYWLNSLSDAQLEKLGGGLNPYKIGKIANIVAKELKIRVSMDVVKQVIHRQKLIRESGDK